MKFNLKNDQIFKNSSEIFGYFETFTGKPASMAHLSPKFFSINLIKKLAAKFSLINSQKTKKYDFINQNLD